MDRMTDRRLSAPHVRVHVLSTSSPLLRLAEQLVFKPQTDLVILNAIANHIIKTGRVNKDFVARPTVFSAPTESVRAAPRASAAKAAKAPRGERLHRLTLEEYASSCPTTRWKAAGFLRAG